MILAPNPFVVFADVTIALSFIFALCSIALSKVLSDLTRDQRQMQVQAETIRYFRSNFSRIQDKPARWAKTDYDRKRNRLLIRNGHQVGEISSNGSYVRIGLTGMFAFGSEDIERNASEKILSIGRIARDAAIRKDLSYVYFHGIVENGEVEAYRDRYGKQITAKELAQHRAGNVYDFLHAAGLIADDVNHLDGKKMNPKYTVDYGKPDQYGRVGDANPNSEKIPGRVDFILFYSDIADEPNTSTTR